MRIVSLTLAAALATSMGACSLARRSDSVPATATALGLRDADSLAARTIAPGVTHTRAWLDEGPWAIHVLEIERQRCEPAWEVRKPAGRLDARARTSALAENAIAALNADFFQLPGGTPVGAHVTGDTILIGPSDRAAWLWDGQAMYAGIARIDGDVAAGNDRVPLLQVNRAATTTSAYSPPRTGSTLFTARAGRMPPAHGGNDVVWIRITTGHESTGEGVVLRTDTAQSDTASIEAGVAALQLHGESRAWSRRRMPGERITWRARVIPADRQALTAREAVGGFPLLLRQGSDVLAETQTNPSFGAQRHPRSAIGWNDATRRVFLVLVDGRQAPYSDGMTLPEMSWLFQRLGATDALNLDGGGSSALVINGSVVNRPSDTQGERAVGNALALARCR